MKILIPVIDRIFRSFISTFCNEPDPFHRGYPTGGLASLGTHWNDRVTGGPDPGVLILGYFLLVLIAVWLFSPMLGVFIRELKKTPVLIAFRVSLMALYPDRKIIPEPGDPPILPRPVRYPGSQ